MTNLRLCHVLSGSLRRAGLKDWRELVWRAAGMLSGVAPRIIIAATDSSRLRMSGSLSQRTGFLPMLSGYALRLAI